MGWSTDPGWSRRALLKRAASQYARHGWPVVPGAYPSGARFFCDRPGCPTRNCHPAFENWREAASCDPASVASWWSRRSHSVLFPTGTAFDVIEAPGHLGEPALKLLGDEPGPCALTPRGRFMFLVSRGEGLRAELADQLHVLLHATGSWVPAPPTWFPDGRVRWRVSPATVEWRLPDSCRVQRALLQAGASGRAGTPRRWRLRRGSPRGQSAGRPVALDA